MTTIKQFTKQSHISPPLIRAVIRQSGGFESFKEMASDITNHGVNGGFHGWICYADTCAFYARNQSLIRELVANMANDLGEDQIEMVRNFNCLGKDDYSSDDVGQTLYGTKRNHNTSIANALSWFACEEVARNFCDLSE